MRAGARKRRNKTTAASLKTLSHCHSCRRLRHTMGDACEMPLLAADEAEESLAKRLWEESKKVWLVGGPAMIGGLAAMGTLIVTQAFVGHVGKTELAGYALSFTVFDRFAVSILLGMSSALETLCGQSFGAKQYHMLGVHLQRSWVVLCGCVLLLLPMFIFTAPLLRLLGQDEAASRMAGVISLWFIPAAFSHAFNFSLQIYLESQSKNWIIIHMAILSVALHLCLSWMTVIKLGMGLYGAMSSTIVALWIPTIGQFLFVVCGGCPDTWRGFSMDAFRDLSPVIKLSLSSGGMICLELWYNTILVLVAGYLGNAEVALSALSICLNISGWTIMVSLGLLTATGVRVANELGAGNAKGAKFSVVVNVGTSLSIGILLYALFVSYGGHLAYLFTDNEEVTQAVKELSPLLGLSILINSIQPVLSGVAVGAGLQVLATYVNLASYYLVGIPLGIVLGYVLGYQVEGIWMGMIVGTLVQTLILAVITWRMDWDLQVYMAAARVRDWLQEEPVDQENK